MLNEREASGYNTGFSALNNLYLAQTHRFTLYDVNDACDLIIQQLSTQSNGTEEIFHYKEKIP